MIDYCFLKYYSTIQVYEKAIVNGEPILKSENLALKKEALTILCNIEIK